VNKLVYVAAGGLAVAAIAVFVLLGSGLILPGQLERPEIEVFPPVVTVTNVSVANVEESRAQVTVKFSVSNPNQRSMYIETLQYNLLINNKPVEQGGQWGDIAEGFVVGSEGLLIVAGGSSPIPAVTTTVARNEIAEEWDSMVDGSANYTLTGQSTYRLTQANLQTSVHEDAFTLTFP
jgi:LEA14-like dessication related protein